MVKFVHYTARKAGGEEFSASGYKHALAFALASLLIQQFLARVYSSRIPNTGVLQSLCIDIHPHTRIPIAAIQPIGITPNHKHLTCP
jgi:hypothetical protein